MRSRAYDILSSVLAVAGPGILALLWLRWIGVPGLAVLVVMMVGALVVVAADVLVVTRRPRRVSVLVGAVAPHAALVALLLGHRAAPLDPPHALEADLPAANPPEGMELRAIHTGSLHRTAAFGHRGGSPFDAREFAMSAVLVKHPRGDVLIDTGFGEHIEEQLRLMPIGFRFVSKLEIETSARAQLDASEYDVSRLAGILLTHAHWDHASGLADFPGVPVWITHEERAFLDEGGWITAVARRAAQDTPIVEYAFEDGAYLGFSRSRDVYGDGSIVIVPAPGHTPGSVIVFVSLPSDERYAFIGDLAWQIEGLRELEERPWPMRTADADPVEVREGLRSMAAIAERFPDMHVVPAHDARAFATIPAL